MRPARWSQRHWLVLGAFMLPGCSADLATQSVDSTVTEPAVPELPSEAGSPPAPAERRLLAPAGTIDAQVLDRFPHDPTAFTQGLLVDDDGTLIESTGLQGESSVRRVDLATGEVIDVTEVSGEQFAEGIAADGDRLIQLTWRTEMANVYDRSTLDPVTTLSYEGEGWGLTAHDGELIMSDGSSRLQFRDPDSFAVVRTVEVRDAEVPIEDLNELEIVGDELWANVWMSTRIARIDPADGVVLGWVELAGLRPASTLQDPEAVANGIAFDPSTGRLFVTGKRWDTLYELAVPSSAIDS